MYYFIQGNNKTRNNSLSVEDYIASTILRSSDITDSYKYSEMTSLIEHLLKIESSSNSQMTKTQNYLPTDVLTCSVLKNIAESTCDDKCVIV